MQNGAQVVFGKDGERKRVPFESLDNAAKIGMLEACVEWNTYMDMGLEPEVGERIIENAARGKPQDRWLEPFEKGSPEVGFPMGVIENTIAGIRQIYGPNNSFNEILENYAGPESPVLYCRGAPPGGLENSIAIENSELSR